MLFTLLKESTYCTLKHMNLEVTWFQVWSLAHSLLFAECLGPVNNLLEPHMHQLQNEENPNYLTALW